jgi:hypothetical protein
VLQFLFQWGILGTLALCIASRHLLGSVASCWRTFPPLALPAVGVMGGMTLMALLEGNYFHVYPLMISMACLAVLGSTLRPAALGDEGSCCRRGIGNAPSVDATRCTNENGKPSEKIKLCEIFTKFRDGSGAAALKCLCVHDQRVARTE